MVTVMMPVSAIVKGQRLLTAVTVASARNGLRNPSPGILIFIFSYTLYNMTKKRNRL